MNESAIASRASTRARGGVILPRVQPANTLALPPSLTRFVKHVRVTEHLSHTPVRYERLPDGETEIVVQTRTDHALLHVVGPRTRVFAKQPAPLRSAIVVRFHVAGAYPFFGRPMSELTDRLVSLGALWENEIEGGLEGDTTACARALIARLALRLADRTVFEPASSLAVRRAVSRVHASPALPSVRALAADVGVSERQLRRAFDDVVGVGPKHYLRIARFSRVLRLATDRADWCRIADATGYADQAHLIGEFREMTGETPAAFVRRREKDARGDQSVASATWRTR